MPKLTDTQLIVLSKAAERAGCALPLPASLQRSKGAASRVVKSLQKQGLLQERPATLKEETWREDNKDQRLTLVITPEGLQAIGVDPEENNHANADAADSTAASPAASVRPGTKQALLIALLQRKEGASLGEIGEATGWQPHSVRGAISGALKKKLGLSIASEKVEGRGRVYRIHAGA